MLSQLNTFTAADVFVVFIYAFLYTEHICLFFDISKFQKHPLSSFNYVNAGILSALITTGSFYTIRLSSVTHKLMLLAAIGFVSATAITMTLQRMSNRLFHRNVAAA